MKRYPRQPSVSPVIPRLRGWTTPTEHFTPAEVKEREKMFRESRKLAKERTR